MAFVAGDVGPRIDLLLDGQGYLFDDTQEAKAEFGLSPIFVERQNVQGNYGDSQQDFFLTFTQRDWSLGEQQRYARPNDDEAARRYWQGSAVDVRIPGMVSMRPARSALTLVGALATVPIQWTAGGRSLAFATSTKLIFVTASLSQVDGGAHGLGASPNRWGIAGDGANIFLSTTAAGTVGVRRFNGTVFSTFSASGADALGFINNTLYGLRNANGDLVRYDTAGTLTSLFTWKDATGTAVALSTYAKLIPFGGKLLILRTAFDLAALTPVGPAELWLSEGAAPSLIARFTSGFVPYDVVEAQGTIFLSGTMAFALGSGTALAPAIFYYANGTTGLLWRSFVAGSAPPALTPWQNGLLFSDQSRGALMYYDMAVGGIHTLSSAWASAASENLLGAFDTFAVGAPVGSTSGLGYKEPAAAESSATVTTSLVDFDSSLTKNFHAVRIEFDAATDGNGGSVDVAYRVGDVDGSYTSLATGVTSGSEVAFSSVSGKSISIKVTLNRGSSTNGPVLKRISVRASVQQPQYNRVTYVLGCYGTDRVPEPAHMELRDGTQHPKSGLQMVADLKTAAARTAPITIVDEVNGTFTGVVEPDSVKMQRIRPGEFRVVLTVRSV